ncbi:peptide ABC transporter permease [Fibrobacterales bacterium]|nr:peptide ABC transporter permease [Fibrobacterales bacterium]
MVDSAHTAFARFKRNKPAYFSIWILSITYLLSLTSPILVNDQPIFFNFNDKYYFPAFFHYPQSEFYGDYLTEPDYKKLVEYAKENSIPVRAIFPPIAWNPIKSDLELDGTPPYPPSSKHLLGTDSHGRDMLSRLIHGFRICMSFSLLLSIFGTIFGIVIGGVQGYFGGKLDIFLQRFIEIWASLPFLYVVILLGSIYGQGFLLLTLIMAAFSWIGLSYYERAEFYKLKNMQFVKAAIVLGLSHRRIFFSEILPNALTPVITLFPFSLIGGISGLTSLDFLGFGLQPPTPSWGDLLSQGLANLYAPWIAIFTIAALFITLLLAAFIGEGIRDALDPKSGDRFV